MLAENGIHIFSAAIGKQKQKQKELGETAVESTEETSLAANSVNSQCQNRGRSNKVIYSVMTSGRAST